MMGTTKRRAACVLGLMLVAAAAPWLMRPTQGPSVAAGPRLDVLVPVAFRDWRVDPDESRVPLDPETQAVIDRIYDQVLARTYVDSSGRYVMLSMVYVRHSDKYTVHRPEICYPGHGFALTREPEPARLRTTPGPVEATRLVARRAWRNEPITYWLVVGGEQTRFGMPLRLLQLRNGFSGAVPDGLLVRISTIGDDEAAQFAVQERFASDLISSLPARDRRYLVGEGAGAAPSSGSSRGAVLPAGAAPPTHLL